jgi:Domain of unknown function (DUF4905)
VSVLRRVRAYLGNPARWRYAPGGAIWRVSPSHPDLLVGEERDLGEKRTRFFCLDKKSGRPRWEKQSFGEQWWIGIEAMNRDTLFLHGFVQPDMPEHQSIIAVDLYSGKELWRNSEVTLHQVFDKTILARKPGLQGSEYIEVDARTGSMIQPPGSIPRLSPGDFDQDIHYPIPAVHPMVGFPEYARVWQTLFPDPVQAILLEVIRLDTCIVAAYHVRTTLHDVVPPLYTQEIVVATTSGSPMFKGVIVSDTTTIVPESFFVQKGALYFVALRNTLVCVLLPGQAG